MPGLPVINDVVAIFGVSSHGAGSVAFVVAAIDLLGGEAESRRQDRGGFEHDR